MGRPRRAGDVATPRSIRATDAEWALWCDAAATAGLSLGDWIRYHLDRAARRR